MFCHAHRSTHRFSRAALFALLCGLMMLFAACGDDDASGTLDGGETDAGADFGVDAGPPDLGVDLPGCPDADGDGVPSAACGGGDCDDADASRYPGATEVCDGDDEDCDDATLGPDADGDGAAYLGCCDASGRCGADCDDARPTVNAAAVESCNGLDDDCDGTIDEGVTAIACVDGDGDGRGPAQTTTVGCTVPVGATTTCNDCDDGDAARYLGAFESCNGVDDDCDGAVDEGCECTTGATRACGATGGACVAGTQRCLGTPGFWESACAGAIAPDVERCDGVDNDCDGAVDEGLVTTFYADCDADGSGATGPGTPACSRPTSAPAGCTRVLWVTESGDCDDANPLRNARIGCIADMDAGTPDLGIDAGIRDLGLDAGEPDFGFDAGEPDLGFDAGEPDLGPADLGFDEGTPDFGFDAGEPDLGFDAGEPDLGPMDLGFDSGLPRGPGVFTTGASMFNVRGYHACAWTGTSMLVWGARTGLYTFTDEMERWDRDVNAWTRGPTAPITGRYLMANAWTGTEFVVWGGQNVGSWQSDGFVYTPATNTSRLTATMGAPSARHSALAVWTGREVFVWGGRSGYSASINSFGDGALYDPVMNTWRPVPTAGAPVSRYGAAIVWTGSEVLVWGGAQVVSGAFTFRSDGAAFNPDTNTWRPITSAGAPTPRRSEDLSSFGVWTGRELLVWGGQGALGAPLADGGRYDPATDRWTPITTVDAPVARFADVQVWTGSEFFIQGGMLFDGTIYTPIGSGGAYDPAADTWRALPAGPVSAHACAVWTGAEVVITGGETPINGTYISTVTRYVP